MKLLKEDTLELLIELFNSTHICYNIPPNDQETCYILVEIVNAYEYSGLFHA